MPKGIILDEKVVAVLKGMSIINQGIVLREDYLHTKFENSIEENSKGIDGIIVNFDMKPEDNLIQLENPVGIGNVTDFLNLIKTFDSENLEMRPNGTTIEMKDKRKKNLFYSTTIDALPARNPEGEDIFNKGETVVKFVLNEFDIEKIKNDLKIINVDKLHIKGEGNNKVFIVGENSVSSNDTKIAVDEKYVAKADGEFKFHTSKIFDVIIPGVYKFDIRKCSFDGDTVYFAKLDCASIPGLSYICMGDE